MKARHLFSISKLRCIGESDVAFSSRQQEPESKSSGYWKTSSLKLKFLRNLSCLVFSTAGRILPVMRTCFNIFQFRVILYRSNVDPRSARHLKPFVIGPFFLWISRAYFLAFFSLDTTPSTSLRSKDSCRAGQIPVTTLYGLSCSRSFIRSMTIRLSFP